MNQHEQGHATASAGSLLFAALLGCLTVLSARPDEPHGNNADMKPDAAASIRPPADF
ncbi:hypothetical protein [Caballeronia udeis]|uniref:hypothetical protein n=1 Tax=Caballeronia udeis TaxID=1232866 RepID=UPI0012E8E828|nr:hypothetical protein [Caballeronia udeis]